MARSLYEIDQDILSCIKENINEETGEVSEEIDTEALAALEMERDAKIEGIAKWVLDMQGNLEKIKAEKRRIDKLHAQTESEIESVKRFLSVALGGEKFKGESVGVSFRRSQSTEVTDPALFIEWAQSQGHEEYLRYKAPEIDRKAIADAIKRGEDVPYAELEENVSVIIK